MLTKVSYSLEESHFPGVACLHLKILETALGTTTSSLLKTLQDLHHVLPFCYMVGLPLNQPSKE